MQESESYIQAVHHQGFSEQQAMCARLFDNPTTYRRWEATHFQLMKSVAEDLRVDRETIRLRKACFALTHRKALFEYLRENSVVGAARVAIFNSFFGTLDYRNAVLTEHGRFLRSTWSLLCADYLESELLHDQAFVLELPNYRAVYADYFSLYCGRIIAEVRGDDYALEPLIRPMKKTAADKRQSMMALPVDRLRMVAVSRGLVQLTSAPRRRPAQRY